MRVLHLIPSLEGGGAERQLSYLTSELAARGVDVHVGLVRRGVNFDRLRAAGARVHDLGPSRSHDPRLFGRIVRTLRRVQPDIAQCWLLQMEVLGGAASVVTGTPWIFSERSSAGAYPGTLKNRLRTLAASFADAIVANSAAGEAYWQQRVPKGRRYVIQNGLPLEEIERTVPDHTWDQGEPNAPLIVFSGRLDEGKNAEAFVEAIARPEVPARARALICGDGPLRSDIARLVAARHLEARIQVPGFVSNLWGVLKRASLFVSPSRFEGSPNAVLEAMACGCPLVLSDIPSHREIVDDESAVFVDGNDAAAVARGMAQVFSDPAATHRRTESARHRARSHAISVVADRYLEVYRDVLRSRGTHRKQLVA